MITKRPSPKRSEGLGKAGLAMSIPTMMVAGPLVGLIMGHYICLWLGIEAPAKTWVKMGLLALGMIAAGRETARIIKRISSDS